MDINEIDKILSNCFLNKDDLDMSKKYVSALYDYLRANKQTDTILPIIIKGIEVDQASSYYAYIEKLSNNDLQKEWKTIKGCKDIKDGKTSNAFKFLSGLFYLSLVKKGKMETIGGNILTFLANMIKADKGTFDKDTYGPILRECIFYNLPKDMHFPKWEEIKATPEVIKIFSEASLSVLGEKENEIKCFEVKQWLRKGIQYADDEIEKKNIQSKIPKSKIDEMKELITHYIGVEKQLKDTVYENNSLEKSIVRLQKEIDELNLDKSNLEKNIAALNERINENKKNFENVNRKLKERENLNAAQVQYRKDSQESLLQDIATALKAEYGDFEAAKDVPMDGTLGEIYKEKLSNVFKILEQKGVQVNK